MKIYNFVFFLIFLIGISGCDSSSSESDPNKTTLYTVLSSKITGLDPGNIGDRPTARVAGQLFECLYQYHYLKRPYEVIPQLAKDMPKVSDNGLTYTITIKKGVLFADDPCFKGGKGRELKVSDFIFAWKRIANIKYLSKNWWMFDSRIIGLNEFREYTKQCKQKEDVDYSRPIEGLQALDDYTLVIKLKKPWSQIIYILAFQPAAPMPKEAVDYYGKDIISHPVGTGPYKLSLWHRGSYIKMLRNPNFREDFYPSEGELADIEQNFLADAGKRLPMVDTIVLMLIQEDQPRWLQFLRGSIDSSGIPKDSFGQAIDTSKRLTPKMKRLGIHLKTFRDPSTYWIGFNMEDSVLGNNKPLREAICYSIDRKRYIELFWNGRDNVAYGFIPPVMKSYNPEIEKYGRGYNPEKAKELVKNAEKIYGRKLPILILSMGGAGTLSRQIGQFYQQAFNNVGLNVEVDYMDWPTFTNKVHSKSVQLFSLGWVADYPDAESFLQLFYSKNISPGTNNFNYRSVKYDNIYEQIAIMSDSPERVELYRKAEQVIIEDCPAAFINHPVAYVLYHDWVGNYKPHVFQYGLTKYRRIDMAKRVGYRELLKKVK